MECVNECVTEQVTCNEKRWAHHHCDMCICNLLYHNLGPDLTAIKLHNKSSNPHSFHCTLLKVIPL
jgi:hypothetical protein